MLPGSLDDWLVFASVSSSTLPLTVGFLTVAGGTILAKSGVTVSGAASGFGTIAGKVSGSSAASWTASGGTLTLGDAGDANGFTGFNGTLAAGSNQINLLSTGVANLGSANTVAGGSISSLNRRVQRARAIHSAVSAQSTGAVKNLGAVTGGTGTNVLKSSPARQWQRQLRGQHREFDGSYSPGTARRVSLSRGQCTPVGAASAA